MRLYEPHLSPFPHQDEWVAKTINQKYWAYFHRMGTGKTKIILDLAGELFLRGEIDAVLIVAPIGVHREWVEIDAPATLALPFDKYISGDSEADNIDYSSPNLILLAMSVNTMSRNKGPTLAKEFLTNRNVLFVIDESTCLKNPSTKLFEHIMELADLAIYKRILAGNPYPEGFFDIWGQAKFLDEDIFDEKFTDFKQRYGILETSYIKRKGQLKSIKRFKPNPAWLPHLKKRVNQWASFVGKEVLGLPEKMPPRTLIFKQTEKQLKLAKAIKTTRLDQHEAEIQNVFGQNVVIKTDSAMARLVRLQEINAGYIRDIEGKVWGLETPKQEILRSLVKEIVRNDPEDQIVIFCKLKPDVGQIETVLGDLNLARGKDYGLYVGGVHDKTREKTKHNFVAGKLKILVVSLGTGSRGLNLQVANHAIFFSNSYSANQREQAEDRIHRPGQKSPCYYYDIIAQDTIDEIILEALRDKISLSQVMTSSDDNIKKLIEVRADWDEIKLELENTLWDKE